MGIVGLLEQSDYGDATELFPSLERCNLEEEQVAHELAAKLLDKLTSSSSRATSCNDVVHDQNLLSWLDGTLLHLEKVLAILLLVCSRDAGPGQLALFADGHKGSVELQGQRGAEQEAARIETDDDVGLGGSGCKGRKDLKLEGAEEGEVGFRVDKDGHNVNKDDALDGEVGKAPQHLVQGYLSTGEFGGGGGGGGGLLSRGILGGLAGCGGIGGGHGGKQEGRESLGGSATFNKIGGEN